MIKNMRCFRFTCNWIPVKLPPITHYQGINIDHFNIWLANINNLRDIRQQSYVNITWAPSVGDWRLTLLHTLTQRGSFQLNWNHWSHAPAAVLCSHSSCNKWLIWVWSPSFIHPITSYKRQEFGKISVQLPIDQKFRESRLCNKAMNS